MDDEINPFAQFVRETFIIDAAGTVSIAAFERSWKEWCEENSRPDLAKSIHSKTFKRHLHAIPGLSSLDVTRPEFGKRRHYTFLRFREEGPTA
jgi:hypothetical protein